MRIEISPTTNKEFTYDEAIMYCFFLIIDGKKGWRLPTREEYNSSVKIWGWHQDDVRSSTSDLFKVTPVRDSD